MTGLPHEPELLLAHADFVRGLAHSLLADPHAGDDVAQQTFVVALERPPRHTERLRGWLARTVQSLANNARRADRRRRLRETAAVPTDPWPSPADVLAREQVREQVVRAVLALEPPFREAVLLRYWEGLSPATIAGRLGIPGATVRSRLKRGLDQLRVRLDARCAGDRAEWRAALAPLACVPAVAESSLLIPMVLLMKKVAIPAAAALALVAAVVTLWRPSVVALPSLEEPPEPSVLAAQDTRDTAPPAVVRVPLATAGTPLSQPDPAAPRVYPAERGTGHLRGQVVDTVGRPVAGIPVVLRPRMGNLPPFALLRDDRDGERRSESSADGAFAFTAVPAGPYLLSARAGGGLAAAAAVLIGAGQEEGPVELVLDEPAVPGDHVIVRVLDAGRAPVAGAEVEGYVFSATAGAFGEAQLPPLRGATDARGAFAVRGKRLQYGVFLARRGDESGMVACSRFDRPIETVEIVLRAAGSLHGHLQGATGELLAGATLAVHALSSTHPYYTSAGRTIEVAVEQGRFRADGLAAGTYGVTLRSRGGLRLALEPFKWGKDPLANSVEMRTTEVRAGESTELVLQVTFGGRIEGQVRNAGRAVAGANVCAVLAPRTSNFADGFVLHGALVWRLDSPCESTGGNPQTHVVTTTGADGRYALHGLQPGRYRVEVFTSGQSYDRRLEVEVRDGETAWLEHQIVAAGVLQIGLADASYIGVVAEGRSEPAMLAIGAHGSVTFPGLAAGRYTVARFHSDASVPMRPLAEALVEAGRTTWLDLRRNDVQAVVTGVVHGMDGPIAGASVKIQPLTTHTAADGSFELRMHYRPRAAAFGPTLSVIAGGVTHELPWPAEQDSAAPHLDVRLGGHALAVRTLGGDGEPREAVVQIEGKGVRGSFPSDGAGMAVARHLRPGTYHVRARLPDGSEASAAVAVPAAAPVVLKAPAGGELRVRVTRGGVPLAGKTVWTETWPGPGEPPLDDKAFHAGALPRDAVSDADGVATFRGIAAGHVRAHISGGFMQQPHERRTAVTVGTVTELAFDLP